jgi:DNA-binding transcriptional LysR family regulator
MTLWVRKTEVKDCLGPASDLQGMMELRHLRYFLAVATERSFTLAAARLGVAQPPLSRQIRDLEHELGAELIDRNCRPLCLTGPGRLLFEQATQILAGVEQTKTLIRRYVAAERRRFVIGCVGSTIYGIVPAMIVRFRGAVPNVDLGLLEMNTLEQISALKEGRIDIGIGRLRIEEAGIRRQVIKEEALVAALPVGHFLAQGTSPIPLASLAAQTVIIYPRPARPSYADQVLSIFRDQGLHPIMIQEVQELQTALGLVAAQSGVCLVPESVQRLRRDDVVYRPIAEAHATSPIIISSRESDTSSEVELFRSFGSDLQAMEAHSA